MKPFFHKSSIKTTHRENSQQANKGETTSSLASDKKEESRKGRKKKGETRKRTELGKKER